MCMLVQPGFCCFFPSWWTSKLRHSRLAWCWLTNNVLLVNLVGCCVNQHPKWLIKKHCQSFEFSKWWVFNFIVSLKLMSGAFRGRISPCCFLTGHPFAGTVKERTNRKWVRKRAGKREKTLFPFMTCEPQVKNTQWSAEVWAVSSFWWLKAESMLFFQWSWPQSTRK